MSFSTQSVHAFLESLASAAPAPGGGTAAALAGAMGTSLLMMVAGLMRTRANSDDERATLAGVRERLAPLAAALEQSADRDAEAFEAVMAAYRRPKATDPDKLARKAAIEEAMRVATETPLETLRHAVAVLELGEVVARLGNPSAASDAGVGAGLLTAAANGAAANVRINLGSLGDAAFRAAAETELQTLLARSAESTRRIAASLA